MSLICPSKGSGRKLLCVYHYQGDKREGSRKYIIFGSGVDPFIYGCLLNRDIHGKKELTIYRF